MQKLPSVYICISRNKDIVHLYLLLQIAPVVKSIAYSKVILFAAKLLFSIYYV